MPGPQCVLTDAFGSQRYVALRHTALRDVALLYILIVSKTAQV